MDQANIQASSDSMWALKVVYLKVTLDFILFFKIDKNEKKKKIYNFSQNSIWKEFKVSLSKNYKKI